MVTVNAYLNFEGNCEEAFLFYQSVFGGEFQYIGRFGDMPPQEGKELPESVKHKIMHVVFPISVETMLMGSDIIPEFGHTTTVGNNISLSINVHAKSEADRLFNGLSNGGIITMPLETTFWGAYFGMFIDKFGINWMVNYDEIPA